YTYTSSLQVGRKLYVRVVKADYVGASGLTGSDGLYSLLESGVVEGGRGEPGYVIEVLIGNPGEEGDLVWLKFTPVGFGEGRVDLGDRDISAGYTLPSALPPRERLDLLIFIPSRYVSGGKSLVVAGRFENGVVATETAEVP
ncbi:MAG: hypothetical protein QI197_06025, partial [Candidatus Korarchaeota archaeon]|nr:hypothetical protein [Candidatus Korarchaeota archaeon]